MRRLRTCFVAALFLGACATAGSGGDDDGDDGDDAPPIDANTNTPIDAEDMPDAPPGTPQPRTLTQSNSMTVTDAHSVTCNQFNAQPPHTRSAENRFMRVFDLNALGITTTYTANRIDFGIEELATTTGTITLKVKLHTLSSAPTGNSFPLANLTQIYTQDVPLPAQSLTSQMINLSTPVIVPAGARLVVEIYAPDLTGGADGNYFFPGSNANGQTGDTYVQAMACGFNDPTKESALGVVPAPNMHLVMAVQGTVP